MMRSLMTTVLTAGLVLAATAPAQAQNGRGRTGVQQAQDAQMAAIPRCSRSLGSLSIVDGQPDVFRELRLSPPQTLLRVVVQRSGCFTLVDRGAGMDAAMRERALSGDGMLQQGSNMGGGQVRSADYVLVAEVASQDQNTGGGGMAAVAGGLLGGTLGGLVGGIRTQRMEANTVLSLTNVRTSESMAVTEGYASRNNLSWGAGGGAGFAGAVGGGYESTEVGRIVSQAFIQAYTDMVGQLGLLEGGNAAAEAPVQSYLVQQATTMRTSPTGGSVVRALPQGMRVYPTGQRDGMWWEILDDNDNRGWVQNDRLAPGR